MDGINDTNNEIGNNPAILYTYDTIMAFVDAIIPRTPMLAQIYGEIMYYGALDFYTDEYMVMILNHYYIPYSYIIAVLLNYTAMLYMKTLSNNEENSTEIIVKPLFPMLSPRERFLALTNISQYDIISSDLNLFNEYPGINLVNNSLNRYTMLGYYSEWYGYGTTRLLEPDQRILEYKPPSWEQIGYPGPSFSYLSIVREYYAIRNKKNETKPIME